MMGAEGVGVDARGWRLARWSVRKVIFYTEVFSSYLDSSHIDKACFQCVVLRFQIPIAKGIESCTPRHTAPALRPALQFARNSNAAPAREIDSASPPHHHNPQLRSRAKGCPNQLFALSVLLGARSFSLPNPHSTSPTSTQRVPAGPQFALLVA